MLKNPAVYSTKCTAIAIARAKWRVLSNYKHDVCNCPIYAQIGLLIADHVREFCYSFDWAQNRRPNNVRKTSCRKVTKLKNSTLSCVSVIELNRWRGQTEDFFYHKRRLRILVLPNTMVWYGCFFLPPTLQRRLESLNKNKIWHEYSLRNS